MTTSKEDNGGERSYWIRSYFKKGKVWARCSREGEYVVVSGRVPFRYKLEQDREYSGHPSNLKPVEGADPVSKEASEVAAIAVAKPRPIGPVKVPPEKRPDGVEPVVIYTDGACSGNPGPAGSGVLLSYQGKTKEIAHYVGIATNNVAELYAVKLALELLTRKDLPVDIFTDSTYVIGVLQKGWKAKENVPLIEEIRSTLARFDDVQLRKVKGHAGIGPNERADELARLGVESRE